MLRSAFILQRIAQFVPVLIGIAIVTFVLLRLSPGDPARLLVGDRASAETLEAVREQYGLNQPFALQFLVYIKNLLQGDLGLSIRFQRPVSELILRFMPPSLFLAAYVVVISVPPTLLLAITAARNPGGLADQIIRIAGVIGLTVPVFWLGIMMSRFFGVELGWFPVSGYGIGFGDHL